MLINYFGHSYFLITGDYSIALDPFSNIGLKEKEVTANYVFSSHNHFDHNNLGLVKNAKRVVGGELGFETLTSYHDEELGSKRGLNEVLKFTLNGKTFGFTGDIGVVDERVVNFLKGADYLFIPVGGTYTVNYIKAKEYVDKINPKCVIPMHYKIKGSTVDISKVDEFLSQFLSVTTVNSPYNLTGNEKGVLYIKAEI